MNENKFSPRAEEALRLSQEAAGELGHGYDLDSIGHNNIIPYKWNHFVFLCNKKNVKTLHNILTCGH